MKKETVNRMKLIIDSVSENESFARYAVSAFAGRLDPGVDELADIRTTVSEAVTNCIIHGYRHTSGKIVIDVTLYGDRSVRIRISDKGCGIADVDRAMQPLYTTDESGERGGMGFPIMQSFSDKLTVRSEVGRGTVVTMVKKFR